MSEFTFDEAFAYIEKSQLKDGLASDPYRKIASWGKSKFNGQLILCEKALPQEYGSKFSGKLILESFAPSSLIHNLESFLQRNGTDRERKQPNLHLINKDGKYNQTLALLDTTMKKAIPLSYNIRPHSTLQYPIMESFYKTISNSDDVFYFLDKHLKILNLIRSPDEFMLTLVTQGLILAEKESVQKLDLEKRLDDFAIRLNVF